MAEEPVYVEERANFKSLLLQNPNYFGTLPNSGFPVVVEISALTAYEELTCVGFNPLLDQLEATVQIKLPSGYGGDLCSAGSTEYVRFYVDYGGGWVDVGLASFNAHDIPDSRDCAEEPTKPLSYVLAYPHEPTREPCRRPVLPHVRAILSWETVPPPNDPTWTPVWGNILDRHIQVKPRPRWFADLVDALGGSIGKELELPLEFAHLALEPLPSTDPPAPSLSELAESYREPPKGRAPVEAHRFAYSEVQAALIAGKFSEQTVFDQIVALKELGIEWSELVAALAEGEGNTAYEELHCLGLDYNREWLIATFTIKLPTGYSGTLCRGGSLEHVAFWVDYDNRCEWRYLGTATMPVYDIATIPPDGLHYWVGLPANLADHQQHCREPKVGRIRAVLSWNAPPSTVDPHHVPYWGNRIDTHIEIKPRTRPPGFQIDVIGGINVAQIDTGGSGLTDPGAQFAAWGSTADPWDPSRTCPFGGVVDVHADDPSGFAGGGYRYRIAVRNTATMAVDYVQSSFPTSNGIVTTWRTPDPGTGYHDFLPASQNVFNNLGWWRTASLPAPDKDQLWEMQIEVVDAALTAITTTAWHRVQLDNTAPDVSIEIAAGGDCKDFDQGDTITGTFEATDAHPGSWWMSTLPSSLSPPNPTPGSGLANVPPGPNTWTLTMPATADPCGYVVQIESYDRSVVNSSPGGHNYDRDDTGFCLRATS